MRAHAPRLRRAAAVTLATGGLLAASAGAWHAVARPPSPAPSAAPPPATAPSSPPQMQKPGAPAASEDPVEVPTWEEVERLIGDDRAREALGLVETILTDAQRRGDRAGWTRALVEAARLEIALGEFQHAVERLRETPWPGGARHRLVLELAQAQALVAYLQAYRWEIAQRERVASAEEVGLDLWTAEQVYVEAQRSFLRAWQGRERWGDEPVGSLGSYVDTNTFPERIRGTLRDAISYLFAELLADSSLWTPEQNDAVYRLDLDALIAGAAVGDDVEGGDALADPDVHPLVELAAVLGDLQRWHLDASRPEAWFEARRARLEHLHRHFTEPADRATIRAALEEALDGVGRSRPWWSMGMATLAEMTQVEEAPDAAIRALDVARRGAAVHPDSPGGQLCRRIAAVIVAPSFSIQAMTSDGPGRRSIQVTHKDLRRLYFRAYRLDLERQLLGSENGRPLPDHREIPALLERIPDARWTAWLPATRDRRPHQTYVTPPLERAGLWVVIASADERFSREGNKLEAVNLVISELALVSRQLPGAIEVTVREGASGGAAEEVEVGFYRYDWREGHQLEAEALSGADGVVRFEHDTDRRGGWPAFFALARRGDDAVADLSHLRPQVEQDRGRREAALVYTDRSVYRPRQELLWKVVAYGGEVDRGRFEVETERELTVSLIDPNGQSVATARVTTNELGSASGSFTVPAGRPLGRWQVRASIGGSAPVRVEEYKRPTFEVTLDDPAEALRLNREARLGGEARYYFGLPVSDGRVRWTVTREPVFPWWWSWWGWPSEGSRVVAAGSGELAADGGFEVVFTPEADERKTGTGISYRYRLDVDVTDPGGETRSAERAFRLGFVSVETRIESDRGFYDADEPFELTAIRTDLDGTPRPGLGTWEVVALALPKETSTPAEMPRQRPPFEPDSGEPEDDYRTPGDRLRPRWDPGYDPERATSTWPVGRVVAAGRVEHGEDGVAKLAVRGLEAGAYRLRYRTRDAAGARFETRRELVVAADGATPLPLPAVLLAERTSVDPGGVLRLFVHSGIEGQDLVLERFRAGQRIDRRVFEGGAGGQVVELPVGDDDRGGFSVRLSALADYQLMSLDASVMVPWDDRRLAVEFASFRDRLRPGQEESWRVTVRGADEETLAAGAAELLAYMYDKSLDLFAPHRPPDPLGLYPTWSGVPALSSSLGVGYPVWQHHRNWVELPPGPGLRGDRLVFYPGYGLGGPGRRASSSVYFRSPRGGMQEEIVVTGEAARVETTSATMGMIADAEPEPSPQARKVAAPEPAEPVELRTDFAETAFWHPHLVLGEGGEVGFELTVPEAVTEWSVWVHALTRDLRGGSVERSARTVKELLVRPYVPRFLREGDRAELRTVVNNAGEEPLSGTVEIRAVDPETGADASAELGLEAGGVTRPFTVEPGGGATVQVTLTAPRRVGSYALEVRARAGDLSDGERRPLPVLPGRVHLAQSRFAALRDADRRVLAFEELAEQAGAGADPTLITDRLVVTLDGQLFYGVLAALPYLVEYPYECTEQTLNRFVSTAIVTSVFDRYPAVEAMARKLAERETRFEAFDEPDPNRELLLEETPWLRSARGGTEPPEALIKVLDPQIASAQRDSALAALGEAQTSSGGFPWWPGGPPSPYMTVYILQGLSRALERGAEVPAELTAPAWRYLFGWWSEEESVAQKLGTHCCVELVTFLNYVLSSYPESEPWTGDVFTAADRELMLERSFESWRDHSPRLKIYLALTLARAGRGEDAMRVFDSVMDSARTDRDLGTYWAPEERSWLWYNDTVETHALALAAMTELAPGDERRDGLAQWLFLNKKLNHWKSTRATAEAIWALVASLEQEGTLGAAEAATVTVGPIERTVRFESDEYTGKGHQIVVPGPEVDPATMSEVAVEKETPGLLFASATWHFSTEELPEEAAEGGLFTVRRRYFRRLQQDGEWVLRPLAEGGRLEVGDQVEVQLSITARHAAEYVHLRDPRGAGFEPETLTSGYRWDLGLARYEEIRDSGTNFFVEWLPAGEYTLTHRLRAATAGTFRTAPATLQSMYAPEFTAYSSGAVLEVVGE